MSPPKETKYAKHGRTGEEKRMQEGKKKRKERKKNKKERKRSEILANSRVVAGAPRHAGGIQVRRWRSTITLSALCRGWFILYASRGTITEPGPNRALISTGVRPLPFSRCLRRDGAAAYGARERDTARVRVGDTRAHGHLENSSSPRQNIGGYPPLLPLPTLFRTPLLVARGNRCCCVLAICRGIRNIAACRQSPWFTTNVHVCSLFLAEVVDVVPEWAFFFFSSLSFKARIALEPRSRWTSSNKVTSKRYFQCLILFPLSEWFFVRF